MLDFIVFAGKSTSTYINLECLLKIYFQSTATYNIMYIHDNIWIITSPINSLLLKAKFPWRYMIRDVAKNLPHVNVVIIYLKISLNYLKIYLKLLRNNIFVTY